MRVCNAPCKRGSLHQDKSSPLAHTVLGGYTIDRALIGRCIGPGIVSDQCGGKVGLARGYQDKAIVVQLSAWDTRTHDSCGPGFDSKTDILYIATHVCNVSPRAKSKGGGEKD